MGYGTLNCLFLSCVAGRDACRSTCLCRNQYSKFVHACVLHLEHTVQYGTVQFSTVQYLALVLLLVTIPVGSWQGGGVWNAVSWNSGKGKAKRRKMNLGRPVVVDWTMISTTNLTLTVFDPTLSRMAFLACIFSTAIGDILREKKR